MKKNRIIPSIVFNAIVSLLTCYGITNWLFTGGYTARQKLMAMMFFTLDSNLMCGVFSFVFLVVEIVCAASKKEIPLWALLLKFVGSSAVGLTFVVVLCLLLPLQGPEAYYGANFIMHLVLPLLAVLSFIFFECPEKFSWKWSLVAFVPCFIYGIVYLIMVVFVGEACGGWKDIYFFNAHGMWFLTMPAVYITGFSVAFLMQLAGKHIKK